VRVKRGKGKSVVRVRVRLGCGKGKVVEWVKDGRYEGGEWREVKEGGVKRGGEEKVK